MKNIMPAIVALPVFGLAFVACTTKPVLSLLADSQAEVAEGPVYYLPTTAFTLSVTFDVYTIGNGSIALHLSERPDDQPTIVSSGPIPDTDFPVLLRSGSGLLTELTKHEVKMTNGGLLKSFNSDVKDVTAEVVQSSIKSIISLAGIVGALAADGPEKTGLKVKLHRTFRVREAAGQLLFTSDPERMAALVREANPEVEKLVSGFQLSVFPLLTLEVRNAYTGSVLTAADTAFDLDKAKAAMARGVPGVLYRNAIPVTLVIKDSNNTELYSVLVTTHDLSKIRYVPVYGRRFSESATALIFSEDGALVEYSRSASSSAKGAASAVEGSLAELGKAVDDLRRAKDDEESTDKTEESASLARKLATAELKATQKKLLLEKSALNDELKRMQDPPTDEQVARWNGIHNRLIEIEAENAKAELKRAALDAGQDLPPDEDQ